MKRKISLVVICFVSLVFISQLAANDAAIPDSNQALKMLKDGNARFVKRELMYQKQDVTQKIKDTASGQQPFATVLSCSDSRVPVEEIFDRGIGDIFVVRVAGNIAMDKSVIGSVEYAVGHLKTPILVVMGHTDCGAVKAAVSGAPLEGDLRDIQEKIETVVAKVKAAHPELKGAELNMAAIKANVKEAKSDLLSQSSEIREARDKGKLLVIDALYDVNTGIVHFSE